MRHREPHIATPHILSSLYASPWSSCLRNIFLRCRHSWTRLHPVLIGRSMQGFGYKAQQAASYNDYQHYCCNYHNYKLIPQQPLTITTSTSTTTTSTTTPIDSLPTPRESLNTESLL
ncbi:hypothetical protein E2C01_051689 [Portunus trituberculatus]|uniref:Uncharacterized protein n=1 Tax=Portunus trituberculatus TaxID=210409 RepID=A0A5B7GCB0_PORTR|nr:hypothetical protein [Portunus trituberculatus]